MEANLAWITCYLRERSQSVLLGNNITLPGTIRCGALQGSVLGPLLFTLYTALIERIIRTNTLLHYCYADDTQVYFVCLPKQCSML